MSLCLSLFVLLGEAACSGGFLLVNICGSLLVDFCVFFSSPSSLPTTPFVVVFSNVTSISPAVSSTPPPPPSLPSDTTPPPFPPPPSPVSLRTLPQLNSPLETISITSMTWLSCSPTSLCFILRWPSEGPDSATFSSSPSFAPLSSSFTPFFCSFRSFSFPPSSIVTSLSRFSVS